jgi:hypothetical protein
VQKAIPYALAIYFVALLMVLWPDPKPAIESAAAAAQDSAPSPISTT